MLGSKVEVTPNRPRDGRHCDLCGCSQPAVRCDKCGCQIFCLSCDDMYHRHPKRRFHLRKAVDPISPVPQARPVLPMKVSHLTNTPGDPSKMPLPPPRKKKPAKSFFDTFRRGSPDTSPQLPKKEYSWTDRLGSIKKFMSNRPLPPLPNNNDEDNLGEMNGQPNRNDLSFIHKRVDEKPPQLPERSPKPPDVSDKENQHRGMPGQFSPEMRNGSVDPHNLNRNRGFRVGEENQWNNGLEQNQTPHQQFGTLNRHGQHGMMPQGGPGYPMNSSSGMQQSASATDLHKLPGADGMPVPGMPHPHYPHYPVNPHMPPHYPYPMYPQFPNFQPYFGNSFANLSNPPTTDGDFSDNSEASSRHHSSKKYPFRKRAKRSQSVMVDRMAYPGQFFPFGPFPPGYGPGPWGAPVPMEAPPSPASSLRSLNRTGRTRRRKKITSEEDDEEFSVSSSPLSRPKSSSSERPPRNQKKAPLGTQTTSDEESDDEQPIERERNEKMPSNEPELNASSPILSSPRIDSKRNYKQKKSETLKRADFEPQETVNAKYDRRSSRESNADQNEQTSTTPLPLPTCDWQCKHCTFINAAGNRICQVCCKTATPPDGTSAATSRPTSASAGSRKQSVSSERSRSSPEKRMPEDDDDQSSRRDKRDMEILNSALDEAEKEISRGLEELMKLKEDISTDPSPTEKSKDSKNKKQACNDTTGESPRPVYKSTGKMRTSILEKLNISSNAKQTPKAASTSTSTSTDTQTFQNEGDSSWTTDRIIEARRPSTSSTTSDAYNSPMAQSPDINRMSSGGMISSSNRKDSSCQTQQDNLISYIERKKAEEEAFLGRPSFGYGDRMDPMTSPLPPMYDRYFDGGFGMMQRSHSRASLFAGRINEPGMMEYGNSGFGYGPSNLYRSLSRGSLTGDYPENRMSEFHNLRKPNFYLSMEELVERRRQETMRAQGLELVRMIREAEQQGFTADDIQVALSACGKQSPMEWLQDNWRNMVESVVTLSTNYGKDKKENDIGVLSENEARDALRLHKGNIWAAVTECVESRQRKFLELSARGKFSRKDIVDSLTSSDGEVEMAYAKLTKSTGKPFLMRIWGSGEGVPNQDGAMPMSEDPKLVDLRSKDQMDVEDDQSDELWDEEGVEWDDDDEYDDEKEDLEDLQTCREDWNPQTLKTPESDKSDYCDTFASGGDTRSLSDDMFFVIPESKPVKKKGTGFLGKLAALRKDSRENVEPLPMSDGGMSSSDEAKKRDVDQESVSSSDNSKNNGPLNIIKNTISAIKDSVTGSGKTEKKLPCVAPERRTIIVRGQIAHESLDSSTEKDKVQLKSIKPLADDLSVINHIQLEESKMKTKFDNIKGEPVPDQKNDSTPNPDNQYSSKLNKKNNEVEKQKYFEAKEQILASPPTSSETTPSAMLAEDKKSETKQASFAKSISTSKNEPAGIKGNASKFVTPQENEFGKLNKNNLSELDSHHSASKINIKDLDKLNEKRPKSNSEQMNSKLAEDTTPNVLNIKEVALENKTSNIQEETSQNDKEGKDSSFAKNQKAASTSNIVETKSLRLDQDLTTNKLEQNQKENLSKEHDLEREKRSKSPRKSEFSEAVALIHNDTPEIRSSPTMESITESKHRPQEGNFQISSSLKKDSLSKKKESKDTKKNTLSKITFKDSIASKNDDSFKHEDERNDINSTLEESGIISKSRNSNHPQSSIHSNQVLTDNSVHYSTGTSLNQDRQDRHMEKNYNKENVIKAAEPKFTSEERMGEANNAARIQNFRENDDSNISGIPVPETKTNLTGKGRHIDKLNEVKDIKPEHFKENEGHFKRGLEKVLPEVNMTVLKSSPEPDDQMKVNLAHEVQNMNVPKPLSVLARNKTSDVKVLKVMQNSNSDATLEIFENRLGENSNISFKTSTGSNLNTESNVIARSTSKMMANTSDKLIPMINKSDVNKDFVLTASTDINQISQIPLGAAPVTFQSSNLQTFENNTDEEKNRRLETAESGINNRNSAKTVETDRLATYIPDTEHIEERNAQLFNPSVDKLEVEKSFLPDFNLSEDKVDTSVRVKNSKSSTKENITIDLSRTLNAETNYKTSTSDLMESGSELKNEFYEAEKSKEIILLPKENKIKFPEISNAFVYQHDIKVSPEVSGEVTSVTPSASNQALIGSEIEFIDNLSTSKTPSTSQESEYKPKSPDHQHDKLDLSDSMQASSSNDTYKTDNSEASGNVADSKETSIIATDFSKGQAIPKSPVPKRDETKSLISPSDKTVESPSGLEKDQIKFEQVTNDSGRNSLNTELLPEGKQDKSLRLSITTIPEGRETEPSTIIKDAEASSSSTADATSSGPTNDGASGEALSPTPLLPKGDGNITRSDSSEAFGYTNNLSERTAESDISQMLLGTNLNNTQISEETHSSLETESALPTTNDKPPSPVNVTDNGSIYNEANDELSRSPSPDDTIEEEEDEAILDAINFRNRGRKMRGSEENRRSSITRSIEILRTRFEGTGPIAPIRPASPFRRMSFNSRKEAIALERLRETTGERKPEHPKYSGEPIKPVYSKRSVKQQLEMERRVRKMVSERKCVTYKKAEIVVQLMDMNFDEDEAVLAGNECATLEQALSYLQQECLLCAGHFPVSQIISMIHCPHKACRDCIRAYFTVQIRDRTIVELLCPFCNEPDIRDDDVAENYFSHLDIMLKKLVDPEIHELFQRKLRDRVLMRDPNFRWCSQCSSGFIAMPNLKRLICPDCNAVTCASCRRPWEREHQGISCEAFAAWKGATDPESQAAGLAKLLTEDGIDCPSCHFRYQLAKGGCMHFRCIQCQHDFCSGCSRPFKMGQKCGVSEFCAKLGLHAHHPRNCLFYLRDKEPVDLQRLLDMNDVKYNKEPPEGMEVAGTCQVLEQKETADGMVDDNCGKDVEEGFAGLCRLHYVEYLGQLVNKHRVDPIQIFDNDDLELVLRRANIRLPPKRYRESDEQYRDKLVAVIQEELPLDKTEGS